MGQARYTCDIRGTCPAARVFTSMEVQRAHNREPCFFGEEE